MSEDEAVVTRGDYRVRLAYDPEPESPRVTPGVNLGTMWTRHTRYVLGDNPGHSTHTVTPGELLSVRNAHRELFPEWWDLNEFIDSIRDHPGITTEAIVKHLVRTHGATVVLPLYLYDHSGLAMTAAHNLVDDFAGAEQRGGRFAGDGAGWDTSYVGFIFDTARTRAAAGLEDASPEKVEEVLRGEVEEYSSYLEGDVWGYVVERAVRTVRVTPDTLDTEPLQQALRIARAAAHGDSNDDEIEAWQEVGDQAEALAGRLARAVVVEHEEWEEVEAVWGYIGHEHAIEAGKEALDRFAPPAQKQAPGYECAFCSAPFATADQMNDHYDNVHPDQGVDDL